MKILLFQCAFLLYNKIARKSIKWLRQEKIDMNYEGIVYRPPSEARSLILQVTIGCAHNSCTFCTMYKDKRFRIRSREEIFADLQEAASVYGDLPIRIFLADGDALVLPTKKLLEILDEIRRLFPYAKRVTAYATASDVLRKPVKDLQKLKDAGLEMVYMGAESGCEQVLDHIRKGVTAEQMILAGSRLKESGIQLSLTLISGIGGRRYLREHAIDSAALVSRMKPEYLGFLTLMLESGAQIMDEIRSGSMELLKPHEVVEEMRLFLEHVDAEGTVFRANHASNYILLKGTLNRDIPQMLKYLKQIEEERGYRPESMRGL